MIRTPPGTLPRPEPGETESSGTDPIPGNFTGETQGKKLCPDQDRTTPACPTCSTCPMVRTLPPILWLLAAGFAADLVLVATTLPDHLSLSFMGELLANMILQTGAFAGLLTVIAGLLGVLGLVIKAPGTGEGSRRRGRGREVLLQGAGAVFLTVLLYGAVSGAMFTRHRFNLIIPALFGLAMVATIPLGRVSLGRRRRSCLPEGVARSGEKNVSMGGRPLVATLIIWLTPITLGAFAVITGMSAWPMPFKYLREPIALVILGLHLLHVYVLWATGPGQGQPHTAPAGPDAPSPTLSPAAPSTGSRSQGRHLLYTCLGGLLLLLTAGVSNNFTATARSEHALVSSLEVTRTYRLANRLVLTHLPLPWALTRPPAARTPGWLTHLGTPAGQQTPGREGTVPTGKPSPCGRRSSPEEPRAQSALIFTIDSLRTDLFGLSGDQTPGFNRLRAMGTEYTEFYQTGTVTMGSLYAWRTGRYPVAPDEHRVYDAFSTLAEQVPLALERIEQDLDLKSRRGEDSMAFINRTMGRVEEHNQAGTPFIIHAHNLALHVPGGGSLPRDFYGQAMAEVDGSVDTLLDYLEESGLAEHTLVMISADHGDELVSERGYRAHGYGVRQTLLRTPFFMVGPGVQGGVTTDRLTSSVDVVPTIMDNLGFWCHYPVHGLSMLPPAATGEEAAGATSRAQGGAGRAKGRHRVVCGSSSPPCAATLVRPMYSDIHACMALPWKLVYNRGDQTMALYNLQDDPGERHNLADSHREEAGQMVPFIGSYLNGTLPQYGAGAEQ